MHFFREDIGGSIVFVYLFRGGVAERSRGLGRVCLQNDQCRHTLALLRDTTYCRCLIIVIMSPAQTCPPRKYGYALLSYIRPVDSWNPVHSAIHKLAYPLDNSLNRTNRHSAEWGPLATRMVRLGVSWVSWVMAKQSCHVMSHDPVMVQCVVLLEGRRSEVQNLFMVRG